MTPHEFIIGALKALPEHRLAGKKRLQKLARLMQAGGLDLRATFTLHLYGPFSTTIADAVEELVVLGDVEESIIQCGPHRFFQSVYQLANDGEEFFAGELTDKQAAQIVELNRYTAVELEIASTISHFLSSGATLEDAISNTKTLKPHKTTPATIDTAMSILKRLNIDTVH